jgi:hypothetical protein
MEGEQSGVFHKMAAQIDQWRSAGHAVRLFILTYQDPSPWQRRFGDVEVVAYHDLASRMRGMGHLVRAVRAFQPEIMYLRWFIVYPQMLRLPRSAGLVIEINTHDLHEYALGSRFKATYNRATRGLILGRADGMVFVAGELARDAAFAGYGRRTVVITNGIDLASYPELPAPRNTRPRLVFVGSAGQPWQGTDKVVDLARLRPEWDFDVVGMTDVDSVGLPNMTWHGPVARDGVVPILGRADVGIGTLALHRKRLDEASALKAREYLAVGLPFFYGNSDPDADALEPLVLRLPNVETNVVDGVDAITQFVERSVGVRIPRSLVSHIDVGAKERARMALFAEVIAARKAHAG